MIEQDFSRLKYLGLDDAKQDMRRMLDRRDSRRSLEQAFYNDPHFFQIDMKEIFLKEWLFVAMSSEMPERGDYVTVDVGDNSVLLVRDDEGGIKAFHNVCRHRGSRLCQEHSGKVANIVCPYHQWTYNLKGHLLYAGSEMGDDFALQENGLKSAHCRVAGGFVFICLAEGEAPEIDDLLATLTEYMEPYDMENTKVAAESSLVEAANWKLVLENNRECYHCNGSHPELLVTLQEWDDTNDPRASEAFLAQYAEQSAQWEAEGMLHRRVDHGLRNRIVRMPLKEGTQVMTIDGQSACKTMMGRIKNRQLGSMRILHLPNSWNHMQSDHVVVFRVMPISAQQSVVTTKWLVHKDAVEGVDYDVDRLRHVWDATNRQDKKLAEENQRGINSIAYQPGLYSQTYEFGVVNFVDWYAQTMAENLSH